MRVLGFPPAVRGAQTARGNSFYGLHLGILYSSIQRTLKCLVDLQPSTTDPRVIAACTVLTHPCPLAHTVENLRLNIDAIRKHWGLPAKTFLRDRSKLARWDV